MSNVAATDNQPTINRDHAVQCLVVMHQITSELLVSAAQSKRMKLHQFIAARQLPVVAREFVEARGLLHRDYQPHPMGSSATRTQRIIGDLHVTVSVCLIDCAKQAVAVAPDLFESKDHEIRRIYELAVEFVASIA